MREDGDHHHLRHGEQSQRSELQELSARYLQRAPIRCIFMWTAWPAVYLRTRAGYTDSRPAHRAAFAYFSSALIESPNEAPLFQVKLLWLVKFPKCKSASLCLTTPAILLICWRAPFHTGSRWISNTNYSCDGDTRRIFTNQIVGNRDFFSRLGFNAGLLCFRPFCGDTSSLNWKDRPMTGKARSSFCSKTKTPNLLKQR